MKILSYNVNGIRSASQKGLYEWLPLHDFDVICLQETKAQPEQIDFAPIEALGYHHVWHSAVKKGYSGVALWSKQIPDYTQVGCGFELYDNEGRVLRADFGDLTVLSVYFPSGSSGGERQAIKMRFLTDFGTYLHKLRQERPNLVISGDYNICHRAIDIHDPVGNKNSSGFLPEERAWMDLLFENDFIDSFRHLYPNTAHAYSWWSFRANSRARNKGWRIDYNVISASLLPRLYAAGIIPDAMYADHCPVWVELA